MTGYEIQDDEDGTLWTSFNATYKEKLIKDWKKNKKHSCQDYLAQTSIDKDSKLYQSYKGVLDDCLCLFTCFNR